MRPQRRWWNESPSVRELVQLGNDGWEHVGRSLQVGEQLHVLLQQALAAVEAQDVRQLKTAIDAWITWDKQMRTNHQI